MELLHEEDTDFTDTWLTEIAVVSDGCLAEIEDYMDSRKDDPLSTKSSSIHLPNSLGDKIGLKNIETWRKGDTEPKGPSWLNSIYAEPFFNPTDKISVEADYRLKGAIPRTNDTYLVPGSRTHTTQGFETKHIIHVTPHHTAELGDKIADSKYLANGVNKPTPPLRVPDDQRSLTEVISRMHQSMLKDPKGIISAMV